MKWTSYKLLAVLIVVFGLLAGSAGSVLANTGNNSDSIDERFGAPIVVYGESLTEEQRSQVQELLQVNPDNIKEYTVTAQDLVEYIGGDPSSRMFSSAKITRESEGNGLVVEVVNPENITEVTNEMYANALLTAGIENAVIEVASPMKVSGHSALTGIYKAYNVDGESLDKDRMEVANEELNVATDLADNENVDEAQVSELLTEIKQMIAEQNPATREEVEQIVQDKLNQMNIELSEEDRQRLIDLFDQIRSLNINFDNVQTQLNDIADNVRNVLDQVAENEGFWQAVSNFFDRLINGLRGLLS